MAFRLKQFETIGCCGIDCGLCPRFHSKSLSACPGCGGAGFQDKHPSCGFLTCCRVKNGFEVCSHCQDYPCPRFDSEKEGFDSFVTHKMVFTNLEDIKQFGILEFLKVQDTRIAILKELIENFDDGRSKSFYCICCTLLPIDRLVKILESAKTVKNETDLKDKSRFVKKSIQAISDLLNIELKLNSKKK